MALFYFLVLLGLVSASKETALLNTNLHNTVVEETVLLINVVRYVQAVIKIGCMLGAGMLSYVDVFSHRHDVMQKNNKSLSVIL